jgi:flagellar protein FliO/FliZ
MLLGVGLLFQIPLVSAQEDQSGSPDPSGELVGSDVQSLPNQQSTGPHLLLEQSLLIGEGPEVASPGGQAAGSGSSVWIVVRMILTLALAAAAVYGVVFFIKRSGKKSGEVNTDPFLKILASVNLGLNRYAHVVSVGGKAWLLGASDGGVNLISEVDDKEVIDAMLLEDARRNAEAASSGKFPDFLAVLRRFGTPVETRTPGADEIRKRRERITRL